MSTYLQPWFSARVSASEPTTDLKLLKDIVNYEQCPELVEIAAAAFRNHVWYLHHVTVGLAFFDGGIEAKEKEEMVTGLKVAPPKKISAWKRFVLPPKKHLDTLSNAKLSAFVRTTAL